jgi:hypothetical protein
MRRLVLLALHIEDASESLALGAASVAAAVSEAHRGRVEVRLVEDLLASGAAGIASRVLAAKPDWLGLSVFSWNRKLALEVAAGCKAVLPELMVVAGGPEASADTEGLFSEAASLGLSLDFILRGEGESLASAVIAILADPASALANALGSDGPGSGPGPGPGPGLKEALASLRGLALPGGGPWGRPPLEDLSLLPSPWLTAWISPRRGGALWELARGCPFRCTYCYEGKGERGLRTVPLARIEAELDCLLKAGTREVFVLDPTFDADKARARALLELFSRKAPGLHWKLEVRAELLDRDLVKRLSRLDVSLQIGLQSASDEVCEAVGRPFDRKAFGRGVALLNEAGVVFGLDLIYGLPKDDYQGFARSLDYALGLQPNHLDVFPLSVLPGTVLAEEAEEYGLVAEASAPHALLSSPGFPPPAMEKARLLARACDLFYSRGRAVSWFLQALRPLRARPSAFLSGFAAFLAGRGQAVDAAARATMGALEVEEAQLAFLEAEYKAKKLEPLISALRDIVRFNGAWGRALGEGESTRLDLVYDPDEVLGPAALDLAAFVRAARPRPGAYVVEPGLSGPRLRKAPGGVPRSPGPAGGRAPGER